MLPSTSSNSGPRSARRNSEPESYFWACQSCAAQRSHLPYFFIGELAVVVMNSAFVSFALNHIGAIVGMCTEKQVGNINTAAVIALVPQDQPIWNRTNKKNVSGSVCLIRPSVEPKPAIAAPPQIASPIGTPRIARRENVTQKTRLCNFGVWRITALPRAIFSASARGAMRIRRKLFSALLTYSMKSTTVSARHGSLQLSELCSGPPRRFNVCAARSLYGGFQQ